MNQRIPATWASCEIGEIADVIGGATPPSKDITNFDESGGIPWITPADLSGYKAMYISRGARNLTEKGFATCSAAMLPSGAVLFSSRAPVGYAVIAANPVCTNQGFKSFVLSDGIDSRFVYFYLRFIKPLAEERATGTTFKELSGAAAARLPLTIAPTNEQKRIADKLDMALARVDACRARLDRVPAILKRFRQAVLAAATSGKLTEEWREAHDDSLTSKGSVTVSREALPPGWWWSCPEEIKTHERYSLAIGPFGSNLKVKDYRPTGVPLVFVREIRTQNFEGLGTKFISEEKALELAAHTISGGDLLITKMGDPPGDIAIYPKGASDAVITADCIKLRVNELVAHPVFVGLVIESPSFRERLKEITAGIAQQKISLERFRRFPLQLAPITEQHEIVRRVEALFAYADHVEARYTAVRIQVERLTPALLAKAFRGELVPQDSNDEPASVLLERIRNVRAAVGETAGPNRRKGGGRPKTSQKAEILMLTRKDIQDTHLTTILKERGPLTAEALWSVSQLDIDDFYDQLKDEEARGLLREQRGDSSNARRMLEAA